MSLSKNTSIKEIVGDRCRYSASGGFDSWHCGNLKQVASFGNDGASNRKTLFNLAAFGSSNAPDSAADVKHIASFDL